MEVREQLPVPDGVLRLYRAASDDTPDAHIVAPGAGRGRLLRRELQRRRAVDLPVIGEEMRGGSSTVGRRDLAMSMRASTRQLRRAVAQWHSYDAPGARRRVESAAATSDPVRRTQGADVLATGSSAVGGPCLHETNARTILSLLA
jgi:hypothetical protein